MQELAPAQDFGLTSDRPHATREALLADVQKDSNYLQPSAARNNETQGADWLPQVSLEDKVGPNQHDDTRTDGRDYRVTGPVFSDAFMSELLGRAALEKKQDISGMLKKLTDAGWKEQPLESRKPGDFVVVHQPGEDWRKPKAALRLGVVSGDGSKVFMQSSNGSRIGEESIEHLSRRGKLIILSSRN